ncbi:15118_t:CDS:2 [Entrophospora sp. SA101]|nr:15118_t:CDS:2 [Entrophospora sp. SA101]
MSKRQAILFDEKVPEVGLYGEWQTEEYAPKPIVNGIVPKNPYGNLDMFKPSMCPPGGIHIEEALSNAKKDKEALARWKRLIVGIKIKMRIHSDYFSRGGDETDVELEEEAAYKKSEQYQSMDIDDDVDVTIERKIFEYIFTVASNLMTDNTNEIGNTAIFGFGQLIRI